MDFRVLGPLEVVADGETLALGPPQQRKVLGLLVLHAAEVVSTDRLLDDVWGATPPQSALPALRLYISRLRRVLEPNGTGEPTVLLTRRPGYLLAVESDDIDAGRFERALDDARQLGDPNARDRLLRAALKLWRGAAYADFNYDDFASTEIRRLEDLRLEALELQVSTALDLGRHVEILTRLEELVHANPLRESLRRLQMLALYRSGRQAEALHVYREARRLLVDELGVEPSEGLRRLERQILLQDSALQPSTGPRRHNLPTPAASFVGRAEAVGSLSSLVGRQRLVTVTGPPGVGKTRLALEVASRTARRFPDGGWLVELAPISDPALVAPTVGAVLGLPDTDGGKLVDRLVRNLENRRVLVVLDNCEHLIDAVADLLVRVIPRASGLHVLATSREVLRISGEFTFPLAPMPVPHPDSDPTQAKTVDAMRLFAERAVAADPRFRLDDASAPDVAHICRRLDGLPLAIELAAARVHALSTADIIQGLERPFSLLADGERGAPAHQRTLEDAVAWSYGLAEPSERRSFRALSVFVGGSTAEDAAAVLAGSDPCGGSVMDTLSALVDKSLITADTQADGRLRYGLLETLREFGRDRLVEAGESEGIRRRHACWFTTLAETADANLDGPEQVRCLRRISVEQENVRAALRWALDSESIEDGLRLAVAMGRFWNSHGDWSEGRRWLERLLQAASGIPVASELLGRAHHVSGTLACQQNDLAKASWHLTLAFDLLREAGAYSRAADTLNNLATVAIGDGDIERARQLFEEALRGKEEAGAKASRPVVNLGWLALESGDRAAATDWFETSRSSAESEGDSNLLAWSELGLGVVAWLDSDLDRAESDFDAAVDAWTELQARPNLVYGHVGQALVLRQRGELAAAADRSVAAIESAVDLGGGERIAFALGIVSSVLVAAGHFPEAVRLMAALQTLAERNAWPIWSWYQAHLSACMECARHEIDDAAFADCAGSGSTMTVDGALRYALVEARRLASGGGQGPD